ncbi:hypothetical protein [Alteromonas sp. ASW11-130]|uniref:hypothetical protein n=1 Tax=Alteromonas sp. ASW11-130 TaxID=3015775 RepID=UPI002241DC55|nr:hypothetical protein [Alteromonas sp. ASW11-130]MCW8090300.1 hypothetical protein [Alteromonas sp. ASW11-130]
MNRKRFFTRSLILLPLSSPAIADEMLFIPRLEAGFAAYDLGFNGVVPLNPQGDVLRTDDSVGSNVFMYRVGATFVYNDFYIDLMGSDSSDFNDVQVIPEFNDIPGVTPVEKWTGDRKELNITVGYQLFETGSIFVGFRDGKLDAIGRQNSNFSYESDGFFAGINYGFPITDTGIIAVNFAYVFVDASLDETLIGVKIPTSDGDGDGVKFGVSWIDSISDTVRYTISVDQYRYVTDLTSRTGIDVQMTEKESAIRIGLSKAF